MDKIQNIQKKIGKMIKDTQGFNYKYFDINQLLEKLTPLLHEEGLILIQPLTSINGKPAIETILYQSDDHIKCPVLNYIFPLPDLQDPQKMGSAITYYRRYSLQSLFALEVEDDDGNKTKPKVGKKSSVGEDMEDLADIDDLDF